MLNRIKQFISDDITRRIANGTFWTVFGSMGAKILILVCSMIVARILTSEQYGELGIIRSTIMFLVGVASAGMGATASKFIAENREKDKPKVINIYLVMMIFTIIMAFVVGILIFGLSSYIATNSLSASHLTNEVRISAMMVFFCVINGSQLGILQGFERFKSIAIVNVLTGVSEFILVILGAMYYGVGGAVFGYAVSFIITTIAYEVYIKNNIKRLGLSIKTELKKLRITDFRVIYRFTLPLALSSFIVIPVIWWTKTYLIQRSGYVEMAVFDIADQWRSQILYIPTLLTGILLPIISNIQDAKDKFWKIVKINFISNFAISMLAAGVIVCCKDLILSGYGPSYVEHYMPFVVLAISSVIISCSNVMIPILISKNLVMQGLIFNVISSSLLVVGCINFVNAGYGATGLALAFVFAYLVTLLAQIVYVYFKSKKWENAGF